MDESILKKIKALPPLDDTVVKIQRICVDKNSSLADLVKVVEKDPMLTANILKSSNSPLYGFSREIKNISHAVALFGMATVRGFALSSAIKQNMKVDLSPYGLDNNAFLDISILQSSFMFKWYSKVDKNMLEVLQPASFMMEVGRIVIANEVIERGSADRFRESVKGIQIPSELSALEKEYVGFDNEEITARIFEQWNLESELVDSIRFSNRVDEAGAHMKPYSLALCVVKNIINIFDKCTPDSINNALRIVETYDLPSEPFIQTIEQFKQ